MELEGLTRKLCSIFRTMFMIYKIPLSNLSPLPHFFLASPSFPMFPSEALHYLYAKEHCLYNMLYANMCSIVQYYFKSTEKSQNKQILSLDFFIIETLISPLTAML